MGGNTPLRKNQSLIHDSWACFVNPELNAPFDTEFYRMTDIPEFKEEFIVNYLDADNLPAMLD